MTNRRSTLAWLALAAAAPTARLAHAGVLGAVMLAWIALPLALAHWRFKP